MIEQTAINEAVPEGHRQYAADFGSTAAGRDHLKEIVKMSPTEALGSAKERPSPKGEAFFPATRTLMETAEVVAFWGTQLGNQQQGFIFDCSKKIRAMAESLNAQLLKQQEEYRVSCEAVRSLNKTVAEHKPTVEALRAQIAETEREADRKIAALREMVELMQKAELDRMTSASWHDDLSS